MAPSSEIFIDDILKKSLIIKEKSLDIIGSYCMQKKNIAMLVFIAVATGTAIVIKKTIDNKSKDPLSEDKETDSEENEDFIFEDELWEE